MSLNELKKNMSGSNKRPSRGECFTSNQCQGTNTNLHIRALSYTSTHAYKKEPRIRALSYTSTHAYKKETHIRALSYASTHAYKKEPRIKALSYTRT